MRARLPVLAATLAVLACAGTPRTPVAAGDGASVARVAITSLDGGAAALSAALGGKPALVSFWAPWCEPCVRELPQLERLAQAAGPCGAAVLGVAVGQRRIPAIVVFDRSGAIVYRGDALDARATAALAAASGGACTLR